ncbi:MULTISPECIES: hypothetical protein [unclassified Bartonella]
MRYATAAIISKTHFDQNGMPQTNYETEPLGKSIMHGIYEF